MEASGQIRQASQNQPLEAVKARVTTRAFGFRLGAFGVDYTSKKVEVDPDDLARRRKQDNAAADAGGYSPASLRSGARQAQAADDAAAQAQATGASGIPADAPVTPSAVSGQTDAQSAQSAASAPADPAWRRGLAAYAKARDILLSGPSRSVRPSLAVA
jgi:hypothetical protein